MSGLLFVRKRIASTLASEGTYQGIVPVQSIQLHKTRDADSETFCMVYFIGMFPTSG